MIAQFPPMGWNSWDCYGAAVTEDIVLQNARYMAEHLKDYGWEYVVVDIQWAQPTAINHQYEPFSDLCMDAFGRLLPAPNRFPSAAGGAGFKPLADAVHALGLKFGIHIMRGLPRMAAHRKLPIAESEFTCDQATNPHSICAWNPDMYGLRCELPAAQAYYDSIFRLYAEWGVDFVKCDDIAREYPHCRREIEVISEAARSCGREIVLSLSPGPAPLEQAEHLKTWANMWRITDDFWDDWTLLRNMFERAEKWCIHAGPGHWPDADMLPLGAIRQCEDPEERTRFTPAEQRTMMTLWCIMRSPLMLGGELTKTDDATLALITNTGVLGMLREGYCAHPLKTTEEESIWIAPRRDGRGIYAALFNLSGRRRRVSVPAEMLEVPVQDGWSMWTSRRVRMDRALEAMLPAHGADVFMLITPKG